MIQHLQPRATPPARVVILGGSGFLGRDLLEHLGSLGVEGLALSSRDLDLAEPSSVGALQSILRGSDALVVAAALTPDKGKDVRTLMRNLTMGEHLAAALERTPCAHVVYVSSDAVYPDSASLITESTPAAPDTLYGLMHVTREKMLALAAPQTGTPFLVLRPCALYGAADTHNSYGPNRFVRSALKEGAITLFGQGEEKRDHLAVRDCARLIALCLAHKTSGTLNAAAGQAVSFAEAAQAIAQAWPNPLRIDCRARSSPVTHRHFDNAALLRAFPTFAFTPLSRGLQAMVEETTRLAADRKPAASGVA